MRIGPLKDHGPHAGSSTRARPLSESSRSPRISKLSCPPLPRGSVTSPSSVSCAPAARAARANGTRLASLAKSASVPLVTSMLTGVWSILPSSRARTGSPATRADARLVDADLGDRALRRAEHGEAAAVHPRVDGRVPDPLAQAAAAPPHAEPKGLRVSFDVLGDTQPAQQRADVDGAGGQIEVRHGWLGLQVQLDACRERRAGDLARGRQGQQAPVAGAGDEREVLEIGAAEPQPLQLEIDVGVGQVDGGGKDRRVAACASAAVDAGGTQRRQLLRIDQRAAHRRHDARAAVDERAPGLDRQLAAAEFERRPVERPGLVRQAHLAAQGHRQARLRRNAQPARQIAGALGLKIEAQCRVARRLRKGEGAFDLQPGLRPAPDPVRAAARVRAACRARCRRGTSAWRADPAACRARGRAGARRGAPRGPACRARRRCDLRPRRRRSSTARPPAPAKARGRAPAKPAFRRGHPCAGRGARPCLRRRPQRPGPAPGRRARRCSRRAEGQASASAPTCRAPGRRRTARRRSSRSSGRAGPARRHATQSSRRGCRRPARATARPSGRPRRRTQRDRARAAPAAPVRHSRAPGRGPAAAPPGTGAGRARRRSGRRSGAAVRHRKRARAARKTRISPSQACRLLTRTESASTLTVPCTAALPKCGSAEPTSRSIGARSSASASTWKRAVRWRASSAPRACNRAPRVLTSRVNGQASASSWSSRSGPPSRVSE